MADRILSRVPTAQLVGRWRDDLGIDVAEYFVGAARLEVRENIETGLVTFDPSPVGGEHLYQALAEQDWYYLEDKWEHQFSLRGLARGARVLEVGCGRGAFLQKAQSLGAEVIGVELNRTAADEAMARGLNVLTTSLDVAPSEWIGRFDRVVSFQVVEHVPDPFKFCEELFSFVSPGGEMHVAVPNRRSFIRRSSSVLDFPPHHWSRWDRKSLSSLGAHLNAKGVSIVEQSLERQHFDVFLGVHSLGWRRLFVNKFTRGFSKALLMMGLSRLFLGHTVVGVYVKK